MFGRTCPCAAKPEGTKTATIALSSNSSRLGNAFCLTWALGPWPFWSHLPRAGGGGGGMSPAVLSIPSREPPRAVAITPQDDEIAPVRRYWFRALGLWSERHLKRAAVERPVPYQFHFFGVDCEFGRRDLREALLVEGSNPARPESVGRRSKYGSGILSDERASFSASPPPATRPGSRRAAC